ncbi:hypothetical protein D7D52_33680 [Nocardia yunnanensis]|uniref:Uncharacterized protein n=2 Tax=Nocardia yunnanensis TaxID=2382165 RepID=A0A386ZK56_9NOCA|nr:hypothetical protein D7D52_33680 [Nocardia yunnanensis]
MPKPIPTVWALIDTLHYAIDAVITVVERIHLGRHEHSGPPVTQRAVSTQQSDMSAPGRRPRIAHRVYDAARTAHWYV